MNGEAPSSSLASRIVRTTALVLLALTPLLNIGEVGPGLLPAVFGGAFPSGTPPWLKLAKDAGYWILLFAGLSGLGRARAAALAPHARRVGLVFGLMLCAVAASAAASVLDAPSPAGAATQLYAGARWALPIFLVYAMVGGVDERTLSRAAVIGVAVLAANVLVQAYQVASGAGAIANASSVLPRASGLFAIPNTAGLFACAVAFVAHRAEPRALAWCAWILAAISAAAAASAGAVIALLAGLYFLVFGGRWLRLRLVALPVFAIAVALNIDALAGRTDVLAYSAPMRLLLAADAASQSGLISSEFGLGTNAGVLITQATGVAQIPRILDSFPATLFYNTGWLGVVTVTAALGALFALLARHAARPRHGAAPEPDGIAFAAMLSAMCLSTSITEAFPVNVLLAMWLAARLPRLVRV